MEFAKFGKEIKSISEIEVMDFVVETLKNRVVVVSSSSSAEYTCVETRYYNEEGKVKYSFIAECELETCRYATIEEYNNFVNGMEELGIEFDYEGRFMVNTKMEKELKEKRKKEDRFLRTNKIAATFMYIVCVLEVLANASDFGLLGCIEFLNNLSVLYSDHIRTIMSGKPIWKTRPTPNYGGTISTLTDVIRLLELVVSYFVIVEGEKSFKGFVSYANERWLSGRISLEGPK